MTRSQAVAAFLGVASAVLPYLLTQPDVVLPPIAKLVLGAANVGVVALALVLKIQPAPPSVTVPDGAKPLVGDGK
jgi:hypothetical protein